MNNVNVQSMTGFASLRRSIGDVHLIWSARSVNGKSLDLRFRLPNGMDSVEVELRRKAGKLFSRGTIQFTLAIDNQQKTPPIAINEALFEQLLERCQMHAKRSSLLPGTIAEILSLEGVIERSAGTSRIIEGYDQLEAGIMQSFADICQDLVVMRQQEGAGLARLVAAFLDELSSLHDAIKNDEMRSPHRVKERLVAQINALMDNTTVFDETRLYAEAVLLATKADITEELDRLKSHITAMKKLLTDSKAIGRKLEFLAQEVNREINTICAKSNALSILTNGLAMKAVADRLREQIQNIE